jgi:hypothetical protein
VRLLLIFLSLLLVTGAALAASAPLNKDVNTPIKTDVGATANRLGWTSVQYIGNSTASTGPEVADADQLLNDASLNQTTQINASTFLGTVDYPRCISATLNASSSCALNVTGTDAAGVVIYDNITISSTTTGQTNKAFKTVTRIRGDLVTGQTNKTVDVGVSDRLGLNSKLSLNTVIWAFLSTTREGTAPTVTVNSTILSLNTIDLNSALNSVPVWIYYVV